MSLKIETFYDTRKKLFDICGNIINKESYQFINILSTYLKDVVNAIDSEIQNSSRQSMVNWREKKNPKLLSKIINNDDNINLINRSMNKITETNYMSIVKEITEALTQDNFRQLPEYSKYLFETVIKKCLNDENLIKDYIYFLNGFENDIGRHIYKFIETYIASTFVLFEKNIGVNEYTYISYIKEITQYYNISIMIANFYLLQKNDKINKTFYFSEQLLYRNFVSCLSIINNFIDWLPSNMDDLNSRIYLIFGIIDIMKKDIFNILNENDKQLLNDILKQIYNIHSISNKIKFKILDIQDMIKLYEKEKEKVIVEIIKENSIHTILNDTVNDTVNDNNIVNDVNDDDYKKEKETKKSTLIPLSKLLFKTSLNKVQPQPQAQPQPQPQAQPQAQQQQQQQQQPQQQPQQQKQEQQQQQQVQKQEQQQQKQEQQQQQQQPQQQKQEHKKMYNNNQQYQKGKIYKQQSQPAQNQPAQNQPAQNQPAQNQPAQNQPAQNQPSQNQPAQQQYKNNRTHQNSILKKNINKPINNIINDEDNDGFIKIERKNRNTTNNQK
jgi:hypothetical protein